MENFEEDFNSRLDRELCKQDFTDVQILKIFRALRAAGFGRTQLPDNTLHIGSGFLAEGLDGSKLNKGTYYKFIAIPVEPKELK